MKKHVTALVLGVLLLAAAWLSMGAREAQTPVTTTETSVSDTPLISETSSISLTAPQLVYRFLVKSAPGAGVDAAAPDGTVVRVDRAPDPRVQRPRASGPCATALVQDGAAFMGVAFSADCPEGESVGVTLVYPGHLPISATSDPPLEWRAWRETDPGTIDVVVRAVPPQTASETEAGPPFTAPKAGEGALCCP